MSAANRSTGRSERPSTFVDEVGEGSELTDGCGAVLQLLAIGERAKHDEHHGADTIETIGSDVAQCGHRAEDRGVGERGVHGVHQSREEGDSTRRRTFVVHELIEALHGRFAGAQSIDLQAEFGDLGHLISEAKLMTEGFARLATHGPTDGCE